MGWTFAAVAFAGFCVGMVVMAFWANERLRQSRKLLEHAHSACVAAEMVVSASQQQEWEAERMWREALEDRLTEYRVEKWAAETFG